MMPWLGAEEPRPRAVRCEREATGVRERGRAALELAAAWPLVLGV